VTGAFDDSVPELYPAVIGHNGPGTVKALNLQIPVTPAVGLLKFIDIGIP